MSDTATVKPGRAAGEHAAQARQDLDPDADADAETDVHERVHKQRTSRSRAVSPILGVLLLGMGSRICPTGSSLTIEHTHAQADDTWTHALDTFTQTYTDTHTLDTATQTHSTDTLDRYTYTRRLDKCCPHTNKNFGIKRLVYLRIQKRVPALGHPTNRTSQKSCCSGTSSALPLTLAPRGPDTFHGTWLLGLRGSSIATILRG